MFRVLVAAALLHAVAWCADWPQWMGPHRDGKSAETGLLQSWPAWALPVIADGRLYLRGQDTLYCYDIRAR